MATYRRRVKATLDEERGVFMISVAAELAEMHPQTLRIYESRGLIEPKRSPKNTRLYSQRDVERLRRIQRMTSEEGLNLAGVVTVLELEERLEKLHAELGRARGGLQELERAGNGGKSGCRRIDSRSSPRKRWRRPSSWPPPAATRRRRRRTC